MALPDGQRPPSSRPGQPRRETLVGSARALGILIIVFAVFVVGLFVWVLTNDSFDDSPAVVILPIGLLPMLFFIAMMWRGAVRRLREFDAGSRSPDR